MWVNFARKETRVTASPHQSGFWRSPVGNRWAKGLIHGRSWRPVQRLSGAQPHAPEWPGTCGLRMRMFQPCGEGLEVEAASP